MSPEEPWPGIKRPLGLLGLARHFGATMVALLHTRVELLATEFEEEVQRGLLVFLSLMLALLFGALSILMLAVTLLVIFWDEHRILVAALITLTFLVITIVMAVLTQRRVTRKPRFLSATIEELKRDRTHLEGPS
jgi:uncharacterized membrane protein YqjE